MTTPTERIAAGYDSDRNPGRDRTLRQIAATYDPARDAEMDRLRKIPNLPTLTRLQIGYHDEAKKAAAEVARRNNEGDTK